MKVVFHIDEAHNWNITLANVKNMINHCKESNIDYAVELVANGPSVVVLTEQTSRDYDLYDSLEYLHQNNVSITACNNSLISNKISAEKLCSFITVVPIGVIELAMRQNEGYAYIRP